MKSSGTAVVYLPVGDTLGICCKIKHLDIILVFLSFLFLPKRYNRTTINDHSGGSYTIIISYTSIIHQGNYECCLIDLFCVYLCSCVYMCLCNLYSNLLLTCRRAMNRKKTFAYLRNCSNKNLGKKEMREYLAVLKRIQKHKC